MSLNASLGDKMLVYITNKSKLNLNEAGWTMTYFSKNDSVFIRQCLSFLEFDKLFGKKKQKKFTYSLNLHPKPHSVMENVGVTTYT